MRFGIKTAPQARHGRGCSTCSKRPTRSTCSSPGGPSITGRLELGIGAGWNQEECDAYGIELPPLRERFDQFDEALEVIVSLLSNEATTFDGEHYQLREARCEPKSVQRPHPPICIGGSGEKRTLRSAAKYAQHWNLAGGTGET